MKQKRLPVGTLVLATRNVGPVRDGQPGIVTGVVEQRYFFWRRPFYLCTFLGNVKVAMKPNEVSDFDHGRSLEELEQDEDESLSVAEQMQRIRPLKR
jgi:hypothetical protein